MSLEQPNYESQVERYNNATPEEVEAAADEMMKVYFEERRSDMAATVAEAQSLIEESAMKMAMEKHKVSYEELKADADAIAARMRQELIDGGGRNRMRASEARRIEQAQNDAIPN